MLRRSLRLSAQRQMRESAPKLQERWQGDVNKVLENKQPGASTALRDRKAAVQRDRDFTPVEQAFPKLREKKYPTAVRQRVLAEAQPADPHVVRAAIVGPPNAGKSTLLNSLVTQHVAATSERAGTTVHNSSAYTTVGNTQIRFIDTPGMFVPKHSSANPITYTAPAGASYEAFDSLMAADVAVFAYSGEKRHIDPDDVGILRKVRDMCVRRDMPLALAITKYDVVKGRKASFAARYSHLRASIDEAGVDFAQTFETSARSYYGVLELKDFMARYARSGEWLKYRGEASDMLPPEVAREMINEAIMRHVDADGLVRKISFQIVGWTRRRDHTEVYIEVFVPSTVVMAVFYKHLPAVVDHLKARLSYALNARMTPLFEVLVSPGGMRPDARASVY